MAQHQQGISANFLCIAIKFIAARGPNTQSKGIERVWGITSRKPGIDAVI